MKIHRLPQRSGAPSAEALADAHARVSAQHTHASRVVILWTPANGTSDFHAEVWQGKIAQVVAC